ncbi:MAG: hypothetical protein K8E24_006990 [Methanobacterium paludis]|nr:hypothetical protein [Methanobacterium paludis]
MRDFIKEYLTMGILILLAFSLVIISLSFSNNFTSFNETQINGFFSNEHVFEIMIPSLVTILAIVFTLSQFIISNTLERYSAEIMKNYENITNDNSTFTYYIIFIVIMVFILVTYNNLPFNNGINQCLHAFSGLLCIIFFFCSFILLFKYLNYILNCVNPFKFSEIFKDNIKKKWREKEDLNEVVEGIEIMGDITVRLMVNYEEGVSTHFIESIYELLSEVIDETKKNRSTGMKRETESSVNAIFKSALTQYYRIYQEALDKKRNKISKKIINNLNEILIKVMENEWVTGETS